MTREARQFRSTQVRSSKTNKVNALRACLFSSICCYYTVGSNLETEGFFCDGPQDSIIRRFASNILSLPLSPLLLLRMSMTADPILPFILLFRRCSLMAAANVAVRLQTHYTVSLTLTTTQAIPLRDTTWLAGRCSYIVLKKCRHSLHLFSVTAPLFILMHVVTMSPVQFLDGSSGRYNQLHFSM